MTPIPADNVCHACAGRVTPADDSDHVHYVPKPETDAIAPCGRDCVCDRYEWTANLALVCCDECLRLAAAHAGTA